VRIMLTAGEPFAARLSTLTSCVVLIAPIDVADVGMTGCGVGGAGVGRGVGGRVAVGVASGVFTGADWLWLRAVAMATDASTTMAAIAAAAISNPFPRRATQSGYGGHHPKV